MNYQNRPHAANCRRDHYAVVRLWMGWDSWCPVMVRCYHPLDSWQTRMWDVELGATI